MHPQAILLDSTMSCDVGSDKYLQTALGNEANPEDD